jgi:site-specific DNA recombinase
MTVVRTSGAIVVIIISAEGRWPCRVQFARRCWSGSPTTGRATRPGVRRQEQDARALADRLGWTVREVVSENDTSAYKRRVVTLPDGSRGQRVVRPGLRRLLGMLQLGESDGLIVYDLDRLARDPRDLEDLIDLVERTGTPVESVTGSLRLSSDADVTMARVMVAVANKASRDMSRRLRRKVREMAEQGLPTGGGRPFGYEPDLVTIRKDEAQTLRWAARRIVAGATLIETVRLLERRGLDPAKARRWRKGALLRMLTNPRYAGLRVHRGEVVGPAVWPPILDRETWERVCAVVDAIHDRQRHMVHWLACTLVCERCGCHLYSNNRAYFCDRNRGGGCGALGIRMNLAEGVVERRRRKPR